MVWRMSVERTVQSVQRYGLYVVEEFDFEVSDRFVAVADAVAVAAVENSRHAARMGYGTIADFAADTQ